MRSSGLQLMFLQLCLTAATTLYKLGESEWRRSSLHRYKQTVHVGSNDSPEEGTWCTDLNETLSNAFLTNKHNRSLEIKLGKGCYNLSSSELATFSGWEDVAIVGQGSASTEVRCSDGVGLTFLSSFGIMLRNLTIVGCRQKQTSTSKNMTSTSDRISFLDMWVGVYFLFCGNVTMDDVQVRESQGVGVVMYNCNGTNNFYYTNFTSNGSPYHEGSGGMAVEFTFCQPGDTNCKDSEASTVPVSQSKYTFFQCDFFKNTGRNGRVVPYPHGTEHVAFGKGGGLSIFFKGRSSGNSIMIDSCIFAYNAARWGGGLYTSFEDQSINNKVTVKRSQFYLNINFCTGNSPKWMKSGGGAQIDFIYYPADNDLWPGYQPKVVGNDVSFYDTYFASNGACWGGAVSVIVSRESPGNSASNSILFHSCNFSYNQASIASAVDVSIFQPDLITSNGTLMKPLFHNCRFVSNDNAISFTDVKNYQVIRGIVYANRVPLEFSGTTHFTANIGTALAVSGTYVSILESSEVVFERNTGRTGGALAFTGNSWLVVHENAQVTFINNSAILDGGAVYSVHFGEHDLIYKWNCFFQYYKAAQPPTEWNATFRFSGNVANGQPNSIYTTSLLPCVWPSDPNLSADHDLKNTFCEHPWRFDTNISCRNEIWTGPSKINYGNQISISAVPGWTTSFNATARNDFGTKVPSVFTTVPFDSKSRAFEVSNSTLYMADNNIVVHGSPNQTNKLLLQTLDPKVISSLMIIDVKNCSFGYKPIPCSTPGLEPDVVCDCICSNHVAGVGCDNTTHKIKISIGTCLSYWYDGTEVNSSKPAVVGNCPFVSEDIEFNYSVTYSPSELNVKVCGGHHMNRTGLLCSKCMEGLGVDANNYRFPCVKCHARYSWIFYVVVELIPVALFFFIMAVFNISATTAPMNAFVFFSQIVTIPYFHNPYSFMFGYLTYSAYVSNILEALVTFSYSIWNLDFFSTAAIPGFCLHEDLGTLDILALKYLNAFLPLVLILFCYFLIQLYDQNYRVIRFLWRPFKICLKKIYKNQQPKTSIIDVMATFLLLSYNKVLFISFSLFTSTSVYSVEPYAHIKNTFYFDATKQILHGKYAVLSILAIIIFAIFIFLPPFFFVFYPLKYSQKLIDKLPFKFVLRTFADVFHGGFRDGTFKDGRRGDRDCRRFAGYYFLFRVVVFAVFVAELSWLEQYFIQQLLCTLCIFLFAFVRPYKEEFYNNLDTAMFTLLALLNAFSLYNSQLYQYTDRINKVAFWINYLLIFLPLLYLVCCVVYLLLLWKGCLKRIKFEFIRTEGAATPLGGAGSIDGEEGEGRSLLGDEHDSRNSEQNVPDRLANPQNYNSCNVYRPHGENLASPLAQNGHQAQLQASSEKSYFRAKRDRQLVPYGSYKSK